VVDGVSASRYLLLACFAASTAACLYHCIKVLVSFHPNDPAEKRGDVLRAVAYSLTLAMSPMKKESARRHVPTYVLGLLFHGGIAVALAWLVLWFFGVGAPSGLAEISALVLALAAVAGFMLLIKRATRAKLRRISHPDDYFSNALLVGFELLALAALLGVDIVPAFFIFAGVLLLYIPLGKLRHAMYFVFARIYLGLFFGRRGVWGRKGSEQWRVQHR
jgi:hypothetical protein